MDYLFYILRLAFIAMPRRILDYISLNKGYAVGVDIRYRLYLLLRVVVAAYLGIHRHTHIGVVFSHILKIILVYIKLRSLDGV